MASAPTALNAKVAAWAIFVFIVSTFLFSLHRSAVRRFVEVVAGAVPIVRRRRKPPNFTRESDRKNVVSDKSGSVSVGIVGLGIIKKKTTIIHKQTSTSHEKL